MIHSFPCKNNGDYLVHIKRGPENICIRIESDSEKQNSDEFCKQTNENDERNDKKKQQKLSLSDSHVDSQYRALVHEKPFKKVRFSENVRDNEIDKQKQKTTIVPVTHAEPQHKVLVDEQNCKLIQFPGADGEPTKYDMVLTQPGITKDNVAVQPGDHFIRVTINPKKSIEDGDVEPEVYCVILPELIASNKTVGEIAPHRRLRVKCVAQGHQAVAQDDTEAAEALLCMSKSKVQKRKR
eukprot:TRINITY_DN2558_c0_g1_i1.p3 TRINITY_DN2558_c0_g1~~TRINITY_DN2558_c0_g1_i1.p3  ORF type:complete len:239 (+),score=26.54 TRINITY_DN2558_c0_g1_i1:174-890(+)